MARRLTKRLTAQSVLAISKPGRHADGEGLYLVVDESGARRWLFMFRWNGKLKEMGLGGLSAVSLAKARQKAVQAREVLGDGINPIDVRKAARAIPTFGEVADDVIIMVERESRNAKHVAGWRSTLANHAAPIREIRVDRITTEDVLSVLKPIVATTPETASRLRGRIEKVLDAAKARGFRSGENPARWRGHLDHLLPKRQKLTRGHHAAMPYPAIPTFLEQLRGRPAMAALALEFLILTAARSNEVIGARWDEIDVDAKIWTVPAARMKSGREHRVPLCDRMVEVLKLARERGGGALLFAGAGKDRPLSTNAFRALLLRMGSDVTSHGFRSSFRDWVGEATPFPREIAEAALAHVVGDATERAYRRGDALEKRRELMDAWANFAAGATV